MEEVIADTKKFYAFDAIEGVRTKMLSTDKMIEVVDLGAGSHKENDALKSIKQIAKSALSSPYQNRVLFRLVDKMQSKQVLELGTSLGISSLYLASALPVNSNLITIEGSEEISKVACENFKAFPKLSITTLVSDFDTIYEVVLARDKPDFIFIDGNHREDATINYFEKALSIMSNNSVMVFDDIYWSEGMERAWNKIKSHPRVTLSIDLFFFGFVFFRSEQKESEHFKIRPHKWWSH